MPLPPSWGRCQAQRPVPAMGGRGRVSLEYSAPDILYCPSPGFPWVSTPQLLSATIPSIARQALFQLLWGGCCPHGLWCVRQKALLWGSKQHFALPSEDLKALWSH